MSFAAACSWMRPLIAWAAVACGSLKDGDHPVGSRELTAAVDQKR